MTSVLIQYTLDKFKFVYKFIWLATISNSLTFGVLQEMPIKPTELCISKKKLADVLHFHLDEFRYCDRKFALPSPGHTLHLL